MCTRSKDGRIVYQNGTSLEKFLEENCPSRVTDPSVFWVMVLNPAAPRTFKNNPDHVIINERFFVDRWNHILATRCHVTADDVKYLAAMTGFLSGKWIAEVTREEVDDVWCRVATATAENRLGRAAKVTSLNISRERPGCRHVIAVYLRDFLDEGYVIRTEAELRRCGVASTMTLTPDIYHRLGLYFQNDYCISPVYLRSRCCKQQSSSQSDCDSNTTTETEAPIITCAK